MNTAKSVAIYEITNIVWDPDSIAILPELPAIIVVPVWREKYNHPSIGSQLLPYFDWRNIESYWDTELTIEIDDYIFLKTTSIPIEYTVTRKM